MSVVNFDLDAISDQSIARETLIVVDRIENKEHTAKDCSGKGADLEGADSKRRKLPSFILKSLSENEVVGEYKYWLGTLNSRDALEELWSRHRKLLRKLAFNMARSYGHVASEDDFLQEAHLGAMNGYKLFDSSKGTTLSTWTYHKAERHLLDEVDKQSAVHVPTQQRKMRSFLAGKYDANPIRRAEVMGELRLKNDEDISKARMDYRLLNSQMTSLNADYSDSDDGTLVLSDLLPDPRTLSQNQLADRMHVRVILETLSNFDRSVYDCLYVQQLSVNEAADDLDVTEGKVRSAKRHLQGIMAMAQNIATAEISAF